MLCACTPFLLVHNGATAATKPPRADGEAVPPCCYRVLAAAYVGLLATENFRESPKGEVRRIPIPRTPVNSLERSLAPHAHHNGNKEQLHKPVTGVDGCQRQRHALVDDGAQQDRCGEDPQQGAKASGARKAGNPHSRHKVGDHKGNDEALNNYEKHRPYRCTRICGSTQLHHRLAEHRVPYRARHERCPRCHDDCQIVHTPVPPLSRCLLSHTNSWPSRRPTIEKGGTP